MKNEEGRRKERRKKREDVATPSPSCFILLRAHFYFYSFYFYLYFILTFFGLPFLVTFFFSTRERAASMRTGTRRRRCLLPPRCARKKLACDTCRRRSPIGPSGRRNWQSSAIACTTVQAKRFGCKVSTRVAWKRCCLWMLFYWPYIVVPVSLVLFSRCSHPHVHGPSYCYYLHSFSDWSRFLKIFKKF